jgi:hypothetical protein
MTRLEAARPRGHSSDAADLAALDEIVTPAAALSDISSFADAHGQLSKSGRDHRFGLRMVSLES